MITPDAAGGATLEVALGGAAYDCVVIGGGLRLPAGRCRAPAAPAATAAGPESSRFPDPRWPAGRGAHPEMATIKRLKSGSWRGQVRRKGRYANETFVRHEDAKSWALDSERKIDRGETPVPSKIARLQTFGELVDLHISDMKEVRKAPGRSKHVTLEMLKRRLGRKTVVEMDRECVIKFGRARANEGAGPTPLGIDVGVIKLVMQHAAAVHGLPVQIEPIDLGRIALKRLRCACACDKRQQHRHQHQPPRSPSPR
jgi:hypothetical protein